MLVLILGLAAHAVDARDVANAWKVEYNTAVARLDAGEGQAALEAAQRALALAPDAEQQRVRRLLAQAAAAAGDPIAEFDALDALIADPKAEWGLFWNGMIDARAEGMPASAHRYGQAALARTPDKKTVAPLTARCAVEVGQLDRALEAMKWVDATAEWPLVLDLTRALVAAERCDDARKQAATLPESGATAPVRELAAGCGVTDEPGAGAAPK